MKEERENPPGPPAPTAAGKASPGPAGSRFLVQEVREAGAAVQRDFSPSRREQEMGNTPTSPAQSPNPCRTLPSAAPAHVEMPSPAGRARVNTAVAGERSREQPRAGRARYPTPNPRVPTAPGLNRPELFLLHNCSFHPSGWAGGSGINGPGPAFTQDSTGAG